MDQIDPKVHALFDFWVRVCAKIPSRVHMTSRRLQLLSRSLATHGALMTRAALAAGAVNPYHWQHGHTKLETLLDPAWRIAKNACYAADNAQRRARWFAAEWSELKRDLDAYRITQGGIGIDVKQRQRVARLRRKIDLAHKQIDALNDLIQALSNAEKLPVPPQEHCKYTGMVRLNGSVFFPASAFKTGALAQEI